MCPFEPLREQLLHAGIAPRHVKRYTAELGDHLSDLVRQLRSEGLAAAPAEARARELLGTDEQLAKAMIERTPRSLAARAPGVVFALMPMLLMVTAVLLTGVVTFKVLWPIRGLGPAHIPAGYSYFISAVGLFTSYGLGLLVAALCIITAVRQRLTSRWLWVGLALIALLSGPLGFSMHFNPGDGAGQGGAVFSMARVAYKAGHPDLTATLSMVLPRNLLLFLAMLGFHRLLQARWGRRAAR